MSGKKNKSVFRPFSVGGVLCACFGIIALAMCSLCIVYTDYRPERVAALFLAIYLGLVVIVMTVNIIIASVSRKGVHLFATAATQCVSAKFLQKLTKPVIICDEKGKIVWYNQYLREVCGTGKTFYNKYLDSICDSTLERIIKSDDFTGTDLHFTTGDSTEKLLPGI